DQSARGLLQGERGSPLGTRLYLWRSSLAMIADRPLLGWGPDTFQLVYPGYRSTELDARAGAVGRDDAVHNALLRVAVSTGLVGVVAYLAVLVAVLLLLLTRAFEPRASGRGPI